MDDIGYERVRITNASPGDLTDDGRRARASGASRVELDARFWRPRMAGPFPAVVVLEGFGRTDSAHSERYGRLLARNGVAALAINSFAARRPATWMRYVPLGCVTEAMTVGDAFAALAWLAARPDVERGRIANIGIGHGGTAALLTAYEQLGRRFATGVERFAAHISICGPSVVRVTDYRTTGAPVTILRGRTDRDFDPDRLRLIVRDLEQGGSAVEDIPLAGGPGPENAPSLRRSRSPGIRKLALRIDPDGALVDERSGRMVTTPTTRLMAIARSLGLGAAAVGHDESFMRQSDDILLRALAFGTQASRRRMDCELAADVMTGSVRTAEVPTANAVRPGVAATQAAGPVLFPSRFSCLTSASLPSARLPAARLPSASLAVARLPSASLPVACLSSASVSSASPSPGMSSPSPSLPSKNLNVRSTSSWSIA